MKNDFTLQYYAVCYLDILNQREKIKEVSQVPTNEAARKETLEKMKGSFGLIMQVRRAIDDLLSALNQRGSTTPKEFHETLRRIEGSPLRVHRIGDAFAIYFPLGDEKGKISLFGVHKLMLAASGIQLMSLAYGIPVRGSITVGIGMEIEENEIYGPVVVRAYDIEQKEADWMRVVLDPSVVAFINEYNFPDRGVIPETPSDKMAAYFYERAAKLIEIDYDGRYVLNYLLADYLEHFSGVDELFRRAVDFVQREYKRFKDNGHLSESGARIAHKYKMTLDFFQKHPLTPQK